MVVVCIDQYGAVTEVFVPTAWANPLRLSVVPLVKWSFGVGVNERATVWRAFSTACVACPATQWALRPTLALRATWALVIRSRTA